ncbi:MAG: methanogenesis marker 17 protein [Methanobrevibacter sp.]|jgi:putative methanogenesis marker protein 17|nr:methanogenesis marker 17 protein [Candidatus Methanovirga meridionalis]
MIVQSNDKDGAKVYEMIIKQILQDLQLSPSIKNMKAFVNPNEVIFIIAIKMDKTSSHIKLSEVAEVTYEKEENKTIIKISDENYLPDILKLLWRDFSRDQLYQPDRYTIILDGDVSFLRDSIVFSPKVNLKIRIIDAIFRIIPEGFRVLRELSKNDIVAIVATDEMIKDEWILKCKELIKELEV